MLRILLRRLGLGCVTLIFVSLLVFGTTQALPGEAAMAILGKEATPARLAALRERLHLNEPVWEQYAKWLGSMAGGDFAQSLATEEPVSQLIAARVGYSAFLVALSALIAVPLSLMVGVISAAR